jgi:DNA-binding GntR family transcriptional regulator
MPPGAGTAPSLLKEDLAQRIREEILLGRIAPGEKIIEARWASQFGVAQTSIREALNILRTEGFVTKRHGRSARVLLLRDPDIIHLYQVRGALEGLAARLVTEQKLPVDDLELALDELRAAVKTNEVRRVVDRVQKFHVCLLEKPQNPFLTEQGRRLVVPLYAFTLMRALSKNLDASSWADGLGHHQRIIETIKMGNPALAEQVVIHITTLFLQKALNVWAH